MNKKANTLLFIVGATLFNILVTVLSFGIMFLLYLKFLWPHLAEEQKGWGFPFLFIGSLAIAFLVYRAVLNFLLTKIEIEKYFDPLFVQQHKKKPKPE